MTLATTREQIKNLVKDSADIVQVIGEYVELKRAGTRFSGLCPFHAEKTPSFSVNPQGQFFHCFGCGESGDVFSFVMKYHRIDFPETLKMLAQKYSISLPEPQLSEAEQAQFRQRDLLYAANEAAVAAYQRCLHHQKLGKSARVYLEQRGVPAEIVDQYRLGYAPDPGEASWSYLADQLLAKGLAPETLEAAGLAVRKDRGGYYDRFRSRIMFPITDMTGRVVAFGGRIIGEGKPKYMNSPESPIFDKSRLLFGLYQHREAIRKQRRALVVEGNFDLLLLAVHGVDNVVAPLGTALTRNHIHSLRGYGDEVVLLFDADTAGLKAAMRSIPFFLAEQVEGRVALLPAGHDPDSYVRAEGAEAIASLVAGARPLAEFAYDTLVREHGLTLAGKSKIIGELKPLIAEAADPEQRALMIAHFCEKLGVSSGYFQTGRTVSGKKLRPESSESPSGLACLSKQEKQVVDFLILYPEFLGDLKGAGLDLLAQSPAIVRIITLLEQVPGQPPFHPEQLLSAPLDAEERAYIVQLLSQNQPFEPDEKNDYAQRMRDFMISWIQSELQKRTSANLQQQIQEAERLGNIRLRDELVAGLQSVQRKRTDADLSDFL
jgi:DNA primase